MRLLENLYRMTITVSKNLSKNIAFYHKDCSDGTMSAAIFLRKYPDAILIPVAHKMSREDVIALCKDLDRESNVWTLDSAIHVDYLIETFTSVTTFDHHISIEDECRALDEKHDNYTFVFDNKKSGATVTWAQLFPDEEEPTLLKYVEDVDIFTQKYGEDSFAAITYLYLYVDNPDKFLELLEINIDEILERGRILRLQDNMKIEKMEQFDPIMLIVDDLSVISYNSSVLKNWFAAKMGEKHNAAVIAYTIKGETTTMSIRSPEGVVPSALDVAEKMGGGGHTNSAGAAMKTKDFLRALQI